MTAADFLPINIPQPKLSILVAQFSESMRFASGTTKHVYSRGLNKLVAYAGAAQFNFTPDDFIQFKLWLLNQERLRTNTVNTYLTASRRFCEFLVESGELPKNPAWNYHGTAQTYQIFAAKLTEVVKAISMIDRSTMLGKRDYAFLSMILETGATISELVNANAGDLRKSGKKFELTVRPKGARGKTDAIALTSAAGEAMSDYVSARGDSDANDPLFGKVRAGKVLPLRLSSRGVREAMRKHLWLGANRRLRLDSIRTYCAVKLMNQGRTLEEIKGLMRFKSNVPFKKIITNSKAVAGLR